MEKLTIFIITKKHILGYAHFLCDTMPDQNHGSVIQVMGHAIQYFFQSKRYLLPFLLIADDKDRRPSAHLLPVRGHYRNNLCHAPIMPFIFD
jgi:hypothetical protein